MTDETKDTKSAGKVKIRRTGAPVDLVRHEGSGRQMSAHRIETGQVVEMSQADAELQIARDSGQWAAIGWKPRDPAAILAEHDARLTAELASDRRTPEEIAMEQKKEAERKAKLETPLSI